MSDEDFEIIEEFDDNEEYVQPSSDELKPGDKVAPGKTIGKNGKVEDSVGKKIVKGTENAAKIGAAVASGGASEGASAASGASNIAKGKASSIGKTTEENALKGRIKGVQKKGIINKVEDDLAYKIDKKAEKDPFFGKAAKEVADKAEVLNTGVGAAESLLSGDMQGFKDNVKGFIKSAANEKLKKIKLVLAGLALAAFAIIIVVEFFIATLSDAWQNFDNKSRKIANNVEKLTNLYRGFGYEDSKNAFYTEMNELDKFYDHKLDIALLLSTVFYSESMGFNKDYSDHLDVIKDDPVNEVLNGDVQGLIDYLVDWEKDIIKESQNTYDENGLVYNAQKIYRLRRLAAAMCDKDTSTDSTMTLKEFIDNEHFKVSKAAADLIMSIGGNTLDLLVNGTVAEYKTLNHFYTFRWNKIDEDLQTFYEQAKQGATNVLDTLYIIISYCSYGFIDLSSIEYQAGTGIVIHYHPYKVNKDKYDDYLKNYYFEDTPDIKELLPKNEKTRNEKKQIILDDIYRNKNLFKEIFLKYEEESSEEYAEACIGAIDNSLVGQLRLPIDTSSTISFDTNSSYGIVDGKRHNGVDLNSTTAGVNAGDNVYAIEQGIVEKVELDSTEESDNNNSSVSSESGGTWIKIKHEDVVVNEKEYTFYSVYRNLDTSSVTLKEGDSVSKDDVIGKIGTTNSGVSQLHFEFRNEKDSPIDPTNLFIKCTNGNSGVLVGDTNEEKIWNYFLSIGYPKAGIAGIMGNMQSESGFHPDRVQGDIPYSNKSVEYTTKVDNGTYSEDDFVLRGPGGGGYGLAQWTWHTRKRELYSRTVKNSISIADLNTQLSFYDYELKNLSDYISVYNVVSTTDDVRTACTKVFKDYENPQDQSASAENARYANCKAIYDTYKDYVTPSVSISSNYSSKYGTQIVNEASKYVGNPYSWGGNSLTQGCDCSHFVYLVLQQLGYNVSYQSTTSWNQGTEISVDDAQPGDVFVISTHMGFIGDNGNIIEAQGASWGITDSRSWNDYKSTHSGIRVYRMYSNIN